MSDFQTVFSTLYVVKILGISRGRIREWTDKGFIEPSKPSSGQGKRNEFTRWELYGIEVFRRLEVTERQLTCWMMQKPQQSAPYRDRNKKDSAHIA